MKESRFLLYTNTKYCTILFLLVLLFILPACTREPANQVGSTDTENTDSLVILHTNDMHGQLSPKSDGKGGMAQAAAYINKVRAERKDVLLLDAGDMTVGTPVSTFFMGKPIFDVMNQMGYDAAVLGNHEFDNGHQYVYDFRDIADFPILSANVYAKGGTIADAPWLIKDVDGLKVGIIGITTHQYIDDRAVEIRKPEEVLPPIIAELEPQVDLIIVLSHLGHGEDKALARAVPGIDVIIGGHSHTRLSRPVQVDETVIAQAGSNTDFVGHTEFQVDTKGDKVVAYSGKLMPIPVDGLEADAPTAAAVQNWESKVVEIVDVKIGETDTFLSTNQVKERVEVIWQMKYKTDFAHHNPGGTRAPLQKGDITIRHIYNSLPFANTLVILQLTKDQVQQIIPDAEFDAEKELYSLITNSYKGNHFIRDMQIPKDRIQWIDESFRDPVIEYIREKGNIQVPEPVLIKE
ncbi:MAG: bifunctional metallophosphatase/5'-nucleotidase [Candidatus Sumerlaeia bacterium]